MAQASSSTAESSAAQSPLGQKVTLADYRNVGLLLVVFIGLLTYFGQLANEPAPSPSLVLGPVIAMGLLIAIVWLLMVVQRTVATMRSGTASAYYVTYCGTAPADSIERPARAFNNLMQLPMLFHIICVLMFVTQHFDRAQLAYCWLFVALRALHVIVYIGWNVVTYRFATWSMGSITLAVLWARFAIQAWPGL